MKHFSIEEIVRAYNGCSSTTTNKFWGLLAILNAIDSQVRPCVSYSFLVSSVSNTLDRIFSFSQSKEYSQSTQWGVMLSKHWVEYVSKELLKSSPNIFDVIIWFYHDKGFESELSNQELIARFLEDTHLSIDVAKQLFSFTSKDIDYTETYPSSGNLLMELCKVTEDSKGNRTITMDRNFVVASPGELSRAPFVQPLYAGQGIQECLILTQFNFSELYTNKHTKNTSFSHPLQTIYYGAPGTGKSHEVKKLTGELDDAGNEQEKLNVFRTTFHPDTDYATFVGCYKPTMKPVAEKYRAVAGKEEDIVYEFVPQAFTDAYIYAYNHTNEPTYLVIEEINRGNCAQIFGDLFQLLDRKADGTSEYTIKADKDLANYLTAQLGIDSEGIKDGKLRLPANLNILATMNTSDQSLFPMDSAFKRRWEWEYIAISYTEPNSSAFMINVNSQSYNWVNFIKQVNERIFSLTQSEDKQLGNFFIKDSIDTDQFKSKVMFYLWYEVLRDEVENSKYFFYYTTTDEAGKDTNHKFTFKDLYGDNANTILEGFLKYITKNAK